MTVYTTENIGRYFLSPYIRIYVEEEGVVFLHTVTGNQIQILCTPEKALSFCRRLMEGISDAEMQVLVKELIDTENPDSLLVLLLRKGVIE